ncbi:MAG: hypothetical protein ABH859_08450 [Pseudomonadota bacterium]
MPRGDGTGPFGQGPSGGGGGRGAGGRGRQGGFAAGPGGECMCPKCGQKTAHTRGTPCNSMKCPKCGTLMTRSL